MSEDILEKVKQEVKKTGHPLSLEVSEILNENGWFVKNGPRYYSEDIKSLREIDIVASRASFFVGKAVDKLIIECKKSEGGNWVFFRQNRKNRDLYTLNIVGPDGVALIGRVYSWIGEKELFQKHYYFGKPLSTYYFIPFVNPDKEKKSKVLDKAINQVIMATVFYLGQREGAAGKVVLFYPIIVFDGKLFEVIFNNGEMEIEETHHVSLLVELEIEKPTAHDAVPGPKGPRVLTSKKFIIDIVRRDYFKDFLVNFGMRRIRKIN